MSNSLCPYCEQRPRARRQSMCQPCARRYRIRASKAQVRVARRAADIVGSAYDGPTRLAIYAALARLEAGVQLTADERLLLGELLWAYAEGLAELGVCDHDADLLYRKLMGHDRATGAPNP